MSALEAGQGLTLTKKSDNLTHSGLFTLSDSDTASDSDCKQMATLHYVELFTLHGVRFRFPSQLQEWDWNRNPDP